MFGLIRGPLTQQYAEEFIYEYGFVRREQLSRLFRNAGFSRDKSSSFLSAIRSYGKKAFYDKKTAAYYASNYTEPGAERFDAIDKCLWVLIDFLGKVEHHFPISSAFSPSQICLMLEDRSYEIAFCAPGNEKYFNNQLHAARTELLYRAESSYFEPIVEQDDKAVIEATRYIVVVDSIEAAQEIRSGQIAFFVTLDSNNECTFYPVNNERKSA